MVSVRRVSTNEDEHSVGLLQNLRQMRFDEDLCDFTIKVQKNVFRVHKCIIAAGSMYFKAMLKHDTIERQEGIVEMKQVDAECVKSCIEFIYSGNFYIPDGKTKHLLHVAVMMQLDKVTAAICDILNKELNVGDFFDTRDIAIMYDFESLSKRCKAFYKHNLMAISSRPEFRDEKECDILNILKTKSLKMSENDKLTLCLSWVGENFDRKESLLKLIKLISINKIPYEFLGDLLLNHPIISLNLQLYKLVNTPLLKAATGIKVSGSDEKKILVFFDTTNDSLRSYDQVGHEIVKFHEKKINHLGSFTAISMESYIYVLCEDKSVHRLDFKDKDSKWERMQDMLVNHGWLPPAVSLSGSLFVIASSHDCRKFVEKFLTHANKWLRLKDKPVSVEAPTLVTVNGSIYCIGGVDAEQIPVKNFCRFTPSSTEWIDLEPMRNAAGIPCAVAVNQKIFVMMELGLPMECYDVTSEQWTSLSPMITGTCFETAHHINGCIFLVSRYGFLVEVDKYDISNDRWSRAKLNVIDCFEVAESVMVQL